MYLEWAVYISLFTWTILIPDWATGNQWNVIKGDHGIVEDPVRGKSKRCEGLANNEFDYFLCTIYLFDTGVVNT